MSLVCIGSRNRSTESIGLTTDSVIEHAWPVEGCRASPKRIGTVISSQHKALQIHAVGLSAPRLQLTFLFESWLYGIEHA